MGYSVANLVRHAALRLNFNVLICLYCCLVVLNASADDDQAFRLRGRFDADAIATTQSAANEDVFGNLGDAIGVRRAWIGAEGDLAWGRYATVIDLASGEVVIRDMFIGLGEANDQGELRAGHYLEPFSLELATASYTLPFLECSPANILDPARNWGLSLYRSPSNNSTHFALGVFKSGSDANDFESGPGSTIALTGRLTTTPVLEEEDKRFLHVGMALSGRFAEDGVIAVNQQPQSPLLNLGDTGSSPFIPTVQLLANFQQLANLQLAAAQGPRWMQAEWYGSWVDQQADDVVFFHGGYVACGCFLTGERRPYKSESGGFGPVQVGCPVFQSRHHHDDREKGWGAWELTARAAYLDFQDVDTPNGASGQLVGIHLPQATLGVNWYLTDHLRLMFNYTYAVPDEPNTGSSVANLFAMRLGMFL